MFYNLTLVHGISSLRTLVLLHFRAGPPVTQCVSGGSSVDEPCPDKKDVSWTVDSGKGDEHMASIHLSVSL